MTIFLTYPHNHSVRHNFAWSLMSTIRHWDRHTPEPLIVHAERCYPGDDLAEGRNRQVRRFLDTNADWFWTVDTDMGWQPEQIWELLRVIHNDADPEIPVASALYHVLYEDGDDGMGGVALTTPTPAVWRWTDDGMQGYPQYPPNTLIQVDAVGAGCLLVHRSVMERVQKEYGDHWFTIRRSFNGQVNLGEDISFCRRLWDIGVPIHVHTGVVAKHNKGFFI